MIKVLICAPNIGLYIDEFNRRFRGKFQYNISMTCIKWQHMRILLTDMEPRGYSVDIGIGLNQQGLDMFTRKSCINIKTKRITTYFDLLKSINNDGTFNWKTYLQTSEDDWLAEI